MDNLLGRHFISLFLILLFSIRLGSQRSARDKELRYFWLTVISCFLLVLEDQAEIIASEDPGLRFWRTLFSVAGYVLRSTATIGLVLVVSRPEERTHALWIPCVIDLLVCSTAFFSDVAFGFDEQYGFYRGPLGYIAFIVPIFYLFLILGMTFKRYVERYQRADSMILLTCAAFCLLSALLDATHGGVRLHEAILISCVFFYLFLRSYDVRRDSLTLLLNRHSLYEDCTSMKKSICATASLDMNGLKRLNDSRGHYEGDMALRQVAECILEAADHRTRAYRIGGDEFVLLFVRQDEDSIRKILDSIQESVSAAGYSIACGYAMREGNESPEQMLQRSDLKMFEQKAKYYQDKTHDRRRAIPSKENDQFSPLRNMIEETPQPVALYRFLYHKVEPLAVSDGFCNLFGYPDRVQAMHVLDHEMYKHIHSVDRERYSGAMLRFSEGKEELDIVYRARTGGGSDYRVIHARGAHVHTHTGERVAWVWYMDEGMYAEDSTSTDSQIIQALSRALHEESILHAAQYDDLTGLPNLSWFFKLCEAGKSRMLDEGKHACLLYMDLNGMKYFNHRNGFAEGDRLLRAFSELLVRLFGKENCCHIGADRFAACVSDEDSDRLLHQLFACARQINDGKTLPVRVGIYSTAMENVPISSAYDRAKMACDAIRPSDVSDMKRYDTQLRDTEKRHQYLIANIDRAVSERWIQVYYQPIVRAVSKKVCHEEALARWIDPVEGFLSPGDFIPMLEKAGLIYKLDLCVLDQVLEKIKSQVDPAMVVVPHSINLSRSDFETCDIVEEIRKRVDASGISRDKITIEITESMIGKDFDFMKQQILRFKELGFPVWMDDFGSGYSSLDVLQSVPFDLIKFDMSFMRKLDESEKGKIILTELMKMATFLDVDTICEGVETEQQVSFLQEIGCSKLQGYYFDRPISLQALKEKYHTGRQIGFEDPEVSSYFEAISRVNLYDLNVLASLDEKLFQHAFNTSPMAIVEIRNDTARYLRNTPSYRKFVQRYAGTDHNVLSHQFFPSSTPFMQRVIQTLGPQGTRFFFDEKMADGSVVHAFARRISANPTNSDYAAAIAILSISEPGGTDESGALRMEEAL